MERRSSNYKPSGSQVRPWLRWAARVSDMYLFSILGGILVSLIVPKSLRSFDSFSPGSSEARVLDIILNFIIISAYAFVEAAMLCHWGTTPGKALLKIRLRRQDGTKLSYREALNRSFSVSLRGLAFGLGFLSVLTQIHSCNRLTKEGITWWDRKGNFSVSHQVIGFFRGTAIILFLGACYVLLVVARLPE